MNILANISSKPFQNASVPTYLPYPWLKLCHAHLPSSCLCIPVVLIYIPDHLPPFTVSSFPCSVSPSLHFSSATYLTPVAFPSTSLSASSFVHLNWTSPHSTPQHCFSPLLSPLRAEVLILSAPPPRHMWIRQLSPPYVSGAWGKDHELFPIPSSPPAAAPSSAHGSWRHRHRRCCSAARQRLRCSAGMEHAHEDIARAGRWPARKISSGDLNSRKTHKFLPPICAKCRFHVA